MAIKSVHNEYVFMDWDEFKERFIDADECLEEAKSEGEDIDKFSYEEKVYEVLKRYPEDYSYEVEGSLIYVTEYN